MNLPLNGLHWHVPSALSAPVWRHNRKIRTIIKKIKILNKFISKFEVGARSLELILEIDDVEVEAPRLNKNWIHAHMPFLFDLSKV